MTDKYCVNRVDQEFLSARNHPAFLDVPTLDMDHVDVVVDR